LLGSDLLRHLNNSSAIELKPVDKKLETFLCIIEVVGRAREEERGEGVDSKEPGFAGYSPFFLTN